MVCILTKTFSNQVKFMLNKLLLQSGNDVPFQEIQLVIHQPSIKEIALIGQEQFFIGCEYLNFSKDNLKQQDKIRLRQFSNFEVLMTMMKEKDIAVKQIKISMQMVLSLLFPDYNIAFLPMSIMISKKIQDKFEQHLIDKDNFENFRNIVSRLFCLSDIKDKSGKKKYNPGGVQAQAIVKKFLAREQKLAKLKNQGRENKDVSILDQYISILAVGENKDKNQLLQYTVYQLFDQFRRFKLKESFNLYVSAKMAGAKDIGEIENWMGDLHSENNL